MGWLYQQKPPIGWPLDPDSGLVPDAGFWPMLVGSGNKVLDLSGNGNTGTFGTGAASPSWTADKFGSALDFDGNDYVEFEASSVFDINGTNPISEVVWIKTTQTPGSGEMAAFLIMTEDGRVSTASDKGILLNENGKAVFYVFDGAAKNCVSTTSVNDGIWHQIVGTYDGVNSRVYVDGILENTIAASETYNFDSPQLVFSYLRVLTDRIDYDGQLDIPSIYNRALSASEIALLYKYPFWMFKDPAEVALLGGYQAVVGMAGAMTTNSGYWGW